MQDRVGCGTLPDDDRRDGTPPRGQGPQAHQRIAPVVPGTHYGHGPSSREQMLDDQRGLPSCVLHQSRFGNAPPDDGGMVEAGRLLRRCPFLHRQQESGIE